MQCIPIGTTSCGSVQFILFMNKQDVFLTFKSKGLEFECYNLIYIYFKNI